MGLERLGSVLLVSPSDRDEAWVRYILHGSQWSLDWARNCHEAWRVLHEKPVAAILSEHDFPDGLSWTDLLDEVKALPDPPPIIVVCAAGEGRLAGDVQAASAVSVVLKPFDQEELLALIRLAVEPGASGRALNSGSGLPH